MNTTRRSFLKYTGATTLTLFLAGRWGLPRAVATVRGGSLDPRTIPKFRTPLLVPPVMPKAGRIVLRGGRNADYYEISLRQFRQQVLPEGLPATTVWGYGAIASAHPRGLRVHHAPALTIEARWDTPVRVKWINALMDASGNYLPHLFAVDPTLHWANPPGGADGRDSRPVFASTPGAYTGPVPMVTHVHGAVGVGDESDGYAAAWYLPAARNIPSGFATEGTWYDFFAAKAQATFGAEWNAGFAVSQYPNRNRASTLWYHDHALGMTRLNVYAGPAGFYLVRGGPAGDDAVVDRRTGAPARLPGPAPHANDAFPSHRRYREIPIAIQDRSFNTDGSLFYPDTREFFDDADDFLPDTDVSPIWNPEFFGNTLIANGNTWPYLDVQRVRYRFRLLNGCQARFLVLDFARIPGVAVWQIGNEGGFLPMPVNITAEQGNRLLLGPAERADVIVDFGAVAPGLHVLANVGPDEPFSGGEAGRDFDAADPRTTGQVLAFRVLPDVVVDPSTPAPFLQLPALAPLPAAQVTRRVAAVEQPSEFFEDAPAEALLGTVAGDPSTAARAWTGRGWGDAVTENPAVGATELWEVYNATPDAHPIHVHEVAFQVVGRQAILVDDTAGTVRVVPGSAPRPPAATERGFKDTAIAYPGEVLRLRMRFSTPGQYVWHCHILEHEDNEMMRPYRIGPVQPGQPE